MINRGLDKLERMSQSMKATIDHISSTPGSFALVHSTDHWPLPRSIPQSSASSSSALSLTHASSSTSSTRSAQAVRRRVHIAILDSSFNPPTLAHQAIAFSKFPPPTPTTTSASTAPSACSSPASISDGPPEYNARLLLFSARNVEKTLKSTDATPEQRVEMMSILSSNRQQSNPHESVGVGLINEPTFVGKAAIIRSYLASLPHLKGKEKEEEGEEVEVDLSFLVGTDTLVRFFDPRFYPPGQMDSKIEDYFAPYQTPRKSSSDSALASESDDGNLGAQDSSRSNLNRSGSGAYLVSARRGKDSTVRALEEEIMNRDGISQWTQAGKVRLLGTGHEGWEEISSTRVREAVKSKDWERVKDLAGKEIAVYIQSEGLYR
ncbi:hypothetical protein IAT40_003429 [Kwoniella sp. CBS 6097]